MPTAHVQPIHPATPNRGRPLTAAIVAVLSSVLLAGCALRRPAALSVAHEGCGTGAVITTVAPDYSAFSTLFDAYRANLGSENVCTVRYTVTPRTRRQFAVDAVQVRGGSGILGDGGAQHAMIVHLGGVATQPDVLDLPAEDDWVHEWYGDAARWSACGRSDTLEVVQHIAGRAATEDAGSSFVDVDSIDLHLRWRGCR